MQKQFKKPRKRILSALLSGILLAGSLAAAEGFAAETTDTGTGALKFSIWSDEETYVRKVVDAYNALKGGEEIILEVIPNGDHEDWLNNYSDEYEVDIIGLRGNTHLLQLQQQGYLLGLSDQIQSSNLDITAYGTMFNEIVYEGEYYALPTRSTCWALYYNKELFDEMGMEYPGQMTWEEYLELAQKISAENEGVWGGYYPPWIYHMMAIQQGYYLLDDDLEPVRESLEFLQRAYESGSHMPFDDVKDRGDDARYDFQKGNIAMIINGEWLANMFLEDEANGLDVPEWDIAPMPVPDGVEAGTTYGMYQFAGITSRCSDPEKAFEFLQFLCGEQGALIYAKNAIIPGYSNEEIQKAYMEAVGTEQASVFFESQKIQEQPMWYGYDQLMNLFEDDARAFMEGQYTLDEVIQLFDEQRLDILR